MRISIGDSFRARIQERGWRRKNGENRRWRKTLAFPHSALPTPIFSKAALPFDLSYSMLRARFVKEDRYGLA